MSSPYTRSILVEDEPDQAIACDYVGNRAQVNRQAGASRMPLVGVLLFALSLLWCVSVDAPADARVATHWTHVEGASSLSVGTPMVDSDGVKYYPVLSAYQGSQPQIVRVLEPTHPAPGKPRRLVFILPVDAGIDRLSSTWGDGLGELRLLDVPNRFNMTLIEPTFNYEPWYGDNKTDQSHRMESFIVKDLVPFGDGFAGGETAQRLLIGFSKSGIGAMCLILRHPAVFQGAAAWDFPAEMSQITAYSALPMNFGSQANLDRYYIPALVLSSAKAFRRQNRLWISGDQAIFTADMEQLHDQLLAASIPHTWVQGAARAHNWHSGWLNSAVIGLDAMKPVLPGRDFKNE